MRHFILLISLMVAACNCTHLQWKPEPKDPGIELDQAADLTLKFEKDATLLKISPRVLPAGTKFVRVLVGGGLIGLLAVKDTWYLPPMQYGNKTKLEVYHSTDDKLLYSTTIARTN